MRNRFVLMTGLLLASPLIPASLRAADGLPLLNGRPAVALVNGDPIFLDELLRARGPENSARLKQGLGSAEDMELLDRLITIRLIAQEAATMGIDELPEIQKQIEVTSREILREVLMERLVKDVKPDASAVENLFRESVREWKTEGLLFQDEATAARALAELADGADFAEVSARAVAAKTAKTDGDSEYHSRDEFLPQIAAAIAPLKVGQVSPPIRLPNGLAMVRVVDIRYPENPEARAAAERQVMAGRHVELLKAHEEDQRRKFVVVNQSLLDSIDYTADQPTLEAWLQDERVVAEIKGGDSVTAGALTDYLRMQMFHGSDQAARGKSMNARKEDALDATLGRRLLNMEALKLGIDKSNAYRDRVTGYAESLIFDSFVQKVIAPENRLREEDVKQYYNDHLKEYSYPAMLKVRGVAFARRAAAEEMMRKVREGSNYTWLVENAVGLVAKGTPGLLALDGQPVTIDSMPEGLKNALAGAKSGDFRLYESPEGHSYVLAVQQVIEPSAKPYPEVREEIAQKVFGEKIRKGVEDYSGKLRAQSKVETYLERMR